MKDKFNYIVLVFLITLIFPPARPASGFEKQVIPVDEIESGMSGYGLTAFGEREVDTFGVEVLGVLENAMPGRDLILIRADSPELEETNILSGMSGSPVYIDDRLVGALAYSWAYQKKPIAGVTPARYMLEVRRSQAGLESGGKIRKISTPVVASGFSNSVVSAVEKFFQERGVQAKLITGGNFTSADLGAPDTSELVPGSPVGVQLVRGDLHLAATGTVTGVNESKNLIYAFGHGFLNRGQAEFPMTPASVQTLLPSVRSSFRISTTRSPVGTVTRDRQAGIVGALGRETEMLPVDIHMENSEENYSIDHSVEIVRSPDLTPQLLNLVVSSFTLERLNQAGVNTLRTELNLQLEGLSDLSFERTYTTRRSYDPLSIMPVSSIWNNNFKKPRVEAVDLDIELSPERREAVVKDIWTDPSVLKPGEKVTVYVRLNPYRSPAFTKQFTFNIPTDLPGTEVQFTAGPALLLDRKRPTPRNLDQLIDRFNQYSGRDQLAVCLQFAELDLEVEGSRLNAVPSSFAAPLLEQPGEAVEVSPRFKFKQKKLNKVLYRQKKLTVPVKFNHN